MESTMELSSNMMQRIIEETIKQTTQAVVNELKRHGMIKRNDPTSFQKTETLLYNYMKFKRAIEDKHVQIEIIRSEGMIKRSKSITSFTSGGEVDRRNDFEKGEDQIEKLENTIKQSSYYISVIETALDRISNDPYYEIIRLKYFEERTREDIALDLGVDATTITRNKNRLLNILKITLFSDDVVIEMMGVN